MSWRELTADQLCQLRDHLVIDVRSPGEHAAECIPHSVNIALLDDAERAEVGIVYKQAGETVARRLALKIISPKIPAIVDQILINRQSGQNLVVHCWRGGLRSEAVASFLAIVGIDCWRLSGGYKAWRRFVLQQFSQDDYRFEPIILHGLTGVGKTEILVALEKTGASVLDLEALAHHRGSVFGGIGLADQPTQKNFEAALWLKLREFDAQPVFIEAESRKIGKLSLPDFIFKRIREGRKVLVTGSTEARVHRLLSQYASCLDDRRALDQIFAYLDNLRERLGAANVQTLKDLIDQGALTAALEMLLREYYDPLYDKQIRALEPYDLITSGDDVEQAAIVLAEWSKRSGISKCTKEHQT